MSKNASKTVRALSAPAPSLGLRDIITGLFNRKWLIVLTLLTSVIATGFFALRTPDKFESRMRFLVKNMRFDAPVISGKDEQVVTDNGEVSESEISSEMELIKSRDLLTEVVKQTGLVPGASPDGASDADVEKAVLRLEKDLILTSVNRANIIEISYTSTSPQTAAHVLTTLGQLYLEKRLKLHRPPGTSEFFKGRADQYDQELRSAENKFKNFEQQKNAVDIDRQKELVLARLTEVNAKLKDLNGKIAQDDKRIIALETQLAGMDARVNTQSRVLPNQYSVERLNTMLVELKNRRIQLLAKFQPEDRAVREVDDQISETSQALQKATGSTSIEQASDINPLRQPLETELSNVKVDQAGNVALRKNLSDQVLQYQARLTDLSGATPIHKELSRQVKQAEDTYQLYSRKQEESQIEDALDERKITNISMIEAPMPAINPNRSNQVLVIVIGLMSGLLLAFGSAFLAEMMRETFLTPRELQAFTGYPVIATVPLQKGQMIHGYEVSESMENYEINLAEDVFADRVPPTRPEPRVQWEYQTDLRD